MGDSAQLEQAQQEFAKSRIFLNHALQLVNAPLVVNERLELIARIIAEYMGVDEVTIYLKEPDKDVLLLQVTLGMNPLAVGKERIKIGTGITGTVAETRKHLSSRNLNKDPRSVNTEFAEDENYPAILAFPIIAGEELVGVVNLRSKVERDFSDDEANELKQFTNSIVGSIRNAQKYERLEYKSKLLELSIKIAETISKTLDIDVILEEIAWEIAHGFGIKGVLLMLMDDEANVTRSAHYGLKKTFLNDLPLETAQSCMMTGKPDIHKFDSSLPFGEHSEDDSWNLCLPLKSRKKTIGVISLFDIDKRHENPEGLFLTTGVDVLIHISQLAALEIENALIHSELKKLSEEDKKKLDMIGTIYSRMSAIFDSISNGIISVDKNGIVHDFNTVARKNLGLAESDTGEKNIDDLISYKTPISKIIQEGRELDNRVMSFNGSNEKIAALVNIRTFTDPGGEQQGSVISFRPMEETAKMLSRFTSQSTRYTFDDIIGNSTTLNETIRLAKMAAQSSSNILIVGESGTGKELFAQSIHNDSEFAEGPFVPVNCAAIPKDLIESELFGYAEGAFTGARKGGYIGKFEQATGGTIFLDEVGDMPLDLQVKLLRVLQEKVIQRVGSEHLIPINTRVVAATNKDLKKAIAEGEFREELFWRLNVISIEIPPLRERKIDIPDFVNHFLEKFSESAGRQVNDIESGTLNKLMEYSWRGNTRELENAIEHAVLMSKDDTITWDDLPTTLKQRYNEEMAGGGELQEDVENLEQARRDRVESSRKLYMESIVQANGDVEKAADRLGISRATLYRRLKKYGLTDEVSKVRRNVNNEN